jgi:hypothetical protein
VDDQGRPHLDPEVALVSNNPYSLELSHAPGTRPTLDSGELGIIVLDKPRAGRDPAHAWTAERLEVTAPAPIHAGTDGEAADLVPPLEFAIRPGALSVSVPLHRLAARAL